MERPNRGKTARQEVSEIPYRIQNIMVGRMWVGSGYCCHKAACTEGVAAHPDYKGGPCPSLRWVQFLASSEGVGRHLCGLIVDADGAEADRLRKSIGVGEGCCSPLNSWRNDVKEIRKHDES